MSHLPVDSLDPQQIAQSWLASFSSTLKTPPPASDVRQAGISRAKALASHLHPAGYLRDLLVFTWDGSRTLQGHAKVSAYLAPVISRTNIYNVRLEEKKDLTPEYRPIGPDVEGVAFGFRFETDVLWGTGYALLVRDLSHFKDLGGESNGPSHEADWKALSVLMMAQDIKGHEEIGSELGAWISVWEERMRAIEENPLVVVVGAGQTGLNIATRLKQMRIPALVLEANPKVGDNWMKRYPSLSLHTPRTQHALLYQPYPTHWPIYTPRDKLASWLASYAASQDLCIWTSSHPLASPQPHYNKATRTWDLQVSKNGEMRTLHPKHIILAAGALGTPRIPEPGGKDIFQGSIIHASVYRGPEAYKGKHVVVVGAGNTSADICQDLASQASKTGSGGVTMVQRSSTCVIPVEKMKMLIEEGWPEGLDTNVADVRGAALPFPLLKIFARRGQEMAAAQEKLEAANGGKCVGEDTKEKAINRREWEMLRGLEKAGFKLNGGSDGSGCSLLVFERFGGYWFDVGCAQLIASGQIKIKQGVEISTFKPKSVLFTDGSELPADAVIFSTGYRNIREDMKSLFGEATINQTDPVWGVDEEGELRGCYKPSGHPGLWYGVGDFFSSRFLSKQLALSIKGVELGLNKSEGRQPVVAANGGAERMVRSPM
ncbi:FAD/NAD-P-binding domain-containing protein [Infundibulicybe gibba]|nr:FAD/NAD-P-binding domain-containing protein [Infundibulicybe gibba]